MIFLVAFCFLSSLEKGGAILVGQQRAAYLFQSEVSTIPEYRNNGFIQTWNHDLNRIEVTVHNKPLKSQVKARPVPAFPQEFSELERLLQQDHVAYQSQQVAIIINWLRTRMIYSRERQAPQKLRPGLAVSSTEAENTIRSMFRKQTTDCVGLSQMALYFFTKLGIDARFVTGVAFRRDDPARLKLEGAVLHRWIEVHYPDAGWVFSDPSGKVNYIEATYLVIGVWGEHELQPRLSKLRGKAIELVAFQNNFRYIAAIPGLDERVGLRPSSFKK